MLSLQHLFYRPFPVNYFIRKPEKSAPLLALISLLFVLVYRPLGSYPGAYFGYEITMTMYALCVGVAAFASFKLIHLLRGDDATEPWTLLSELLSVGFVLINLGTAVFLSAFLLEEAAPRWNWDTYANSLQNTALITGIPMVAATIRQFKTLFSYAGGQETVNLVNIPKSGDPQIIIQTPLKKDDPVFRASQLLYAEADGNYVKFHLLEAHEYGRTDERYGGSTPAGSRTMAGRADERYSGGDEDSAKVSHTHGPDAPILKGRLKVHVKTVRISIDSLEEQFKPYPVFMRTHRAFIVNLRHVREASGNTLGLQLKLSHSADEIPVSRTNVKRFIAMFKTANA